MITSTFRLWNNGVKLSNNMQREEKKLETRYLDHDYLNYRFSNYRYNKNRESAKKNEELANQARYNATQIAKEARAYEKKVMRYENQARNVWEKSEKLWKNYNFMNYKAMQYMNDANNYLVNSINYDTRTSNRKSNCYNSWDIRDNHERNNNSRRFRKRLGF